MTYYSDYLYRDISILFEQAHCGKSVAESHGLFCGIYCATGLENYSLWEQAVMGCSGLNQQIRTIFKHIHQRTCEQLNSGNFTLSLLLPDSESTLIHRNMALSRWCQGFLSGLEVGGVTRFKASSEINHFIQDITKIARVSHLTSGASAYGEHAFEQIVEYIRAGVQLVKEDFYLLQLMQGQSQSNSMRSLH